MKKETTLQIALCLYIRFQYPGVFFASDMSGMSTTKTQAKLACAMRSGNGWPDLFIAEAKGPYHGLFIELKASREELYTKEGFFRNNEHIQKQNAIRLQLSDKGFCAKFACGFDEAQKIVDEYLNLK